MFLIIRIDKQSLNHKLWGFILILSVPWGQLRTKCTCRTTFFHRSGTFFICFCGNTDVVLGGLYELNSFTLTIWALSPCEVVKVKLLRYIPEQGVLGLQSRPEGAVFCSLIRELVGIELFSLYDNLVRVELGARKINMIEILFCTETEKYIQFVGSTLPKICIQLKSAPNKSCSELPFQYQIIFHLFHSFEPLAPPRKGGR